jgi:hypothetical protein
LPYLGKFLKTYSAAKQEAKQEVRRAQVGAEDSIAAARQRIKEKAAEEILAARSRWF